MLLFALFSARPAVAQEALGGIDGRVVRAGQGIPIVTVTIDQLARSTETDPAGRYFFANVPGGTYDLSFALGTSSASEPRVTVSAGQTTALETVVDWQLFFVETGIVTAASRGMERIVDAPAAATSLDADAIAARASNGQLPKALAFSPGVELTQSGLYDFNLNARGFNTAVNRHVQTMIDGRDPSVPVLRGYVEWAATTFPLDEVQRLEFVRGPGSALYGAGAFNGVLSATTKAPRDSIGGFARLTAGSLATVRGDLRHAADLGGGWFVKGMAGYSESGDFTKSRVDSVEYAPGLLAPEAVAPSLDRRRIAYGSARVDKYFAPRTALVVEGGLSHVEGPLTVTNVGRLQATDVMRPWVRVNFNMPNWNVSGYYTGRDSDDQINLGSGQGVYLSSRNVEAEVQGNATFNNGKGLVVGGGTVGQQYVDSSNPDGFHTIFQRAETVNRGAVFGQIDYFFATGFNVVASLRWDNSSLHDDQFSPRLAVVYTPVPDHSFRISYSDGFQRPGVAEYFLKTSVAPPLDLSLLESALAPFLGGVPLGFEQIPLLAVGNESLIVEQIRTFEIGYNGMFADDFFINISYYRSHLQDFTTSFLPNVGTSLGRVNPAYQAYVPPAALSDQAAAIVLGSLQLALPPEFYAQMSNDADESPIFAVVSLANFGDADTQGIEAGLNYAPTPTWRFDFNYTLFDYTISRQLPESPLVPNAPQHQVGAGVFYFGDKFDAGLRYRWVDEFLWVAGIYVGPVEAYNFVDLNAMVPVNDRFRVGLDVSNLLDNSHYQLFGGDLLGIRTLLDLTVSW